MKIALKTCLFYFDSSCLMLQTTKGPPLMPVRGGREEWQWKSVFNVSSGCFFRQKMTKEKLQTTTIKRTCRPFQKVWISLPADPPKSPDLSINQPECFPDARGRHTRKKEEKRKVWQWVAGRESDNSMVNNNQIYLWPCRARLGPCFPFVSVEDDREKKGKKQKSFEFNIFQSITASTTYCCSGAHHHGEAGGGRVCESDIAFTVFILFDKLP